MTATAVARELAGMLSRTAPHVGDPEVGWAPLLALAADHQLLPGIWSALRRQGITALPPALATGGSPLAIVEARHRENARRIAGLRAQLEQVLDALDAAGIAAIALKGGHWLLADLLTDPAARVMVDVDVLVPSALAGEARATLEDLGYRSGPVPDDQEPTDHQLEPLFLPGAAGSVELHVEPMVESRRSLLDASAVRAAARPVDVDRATRWLPDPTTAMVLLIGHAQLQEDGARLLRLPLRALHDLHSLGPGFRDLVDWDSVEARFWQHGSGGRVALAGFASAADAYFGISLPTTGRGGAIWLRAVEAALDHPDAATRYRDAAYLPLALRADRMRRLHGVDHGAGLWAARTRHVASGARRRLRHRDPPIVGHDVESPHVTEP